MKDELLMQPDATESPKRSVWRNGRKETNYQIKTYTKQKWKIKK